MSTDKPLQPPQEEEQATSLFPVTEIEPAAARPSGSGKRRGRLSKKRAIPAMPYQPAFAEQLLRFFDVPPFRITEVQKKDGSISLLETASELPTFAAFARSLGTTQAQLMTWENEYPDFAQAARKARDLQADILIQNSLRGNYAASFAMFTAKNILGWTDGKETAFPTEKILTVRWKK